MCGIAGVVAPAGERADRRTLERMVASVRHPIHVLEAALMGADVVTVPFAVLQQLAHHPLTDIGLERFLKDWEKVPKG